MSADADHEVIDSPEALIRHLYEEHGVEEARDLDPETAPVQFWLRRHAELEREERLLQDFGERIRDVRQGPDGALWLATDSSSGRILRVTPPRPAG